MFAVEQLISPLKLRYPQTKALLLEKFLIVCLEDCIDGGKQRFALFQHQLGHTYGLHYVGSYCVDIIIDIPASPETVNWLRNQTTHVY